MPEHASVSWYKEAIFIANSIRNIPRETNNNFIVDIYSKPLKRIGDALAFAEKKESTYVIIYKIEKKMNIKTEI